MTQQQPNSSITACNIKTYIIYYYSSDVERIEANTIEEAIKKAKDKMEYIWKVCEVRL